MNFRLFNYATVIILKSKWTYMRENFMKDASFACSKLDRSSDFPQCTFNNILIHFRMVSSSIEDVGRLILD